MAYTLSKTNGQTLIFLNDGLVDTAASSINLIGKNVTNFGDAQNENFVHMLENFAYTAEPNKPLQGQLWFNSNDAVLRPVVFDGTKTWRPLAVLLYSTGTTDTLINAGGYDFSATVPGDMWFNKGTNQLYVITGTNAESTLIGPETVKGFDTTKMSSVKMTDVSNSSYPVIQITLGGEVIGIISSSSFVANTSTAVAGFSKINRGITFKNYNSSTRYTTATTDVQLFGLHEQLDTSVTRRNVDEHLQSNWTFDNNFSVNFGTTTQSSVTWTSPNLVLNSTGGIKLQSATTALTFTGDALTPSASTVDLGTSSNKYNALYVNTVSATTITVPTVNAVTVTATNVIASGTLSGALTMSSMVDAFNNTINRFDVDGTFTRNSDAVLPSQKSIKTYVDTALGNLSNSLLATIAALQLQLDNTSAVLAGTIFYTAGSVIPAGYLLCDGSSLSTTAYPTLFSAIGYTYGGSDTTFQLPDLRGEFVRGVDAGRGIDVGRTLGSLQDHLTVSHNHNITLAGNTTSAGIHSHSASSAVNDPSHSHLMPGDDQLSFANGYAGWPARSAGGFPYDSKSNYGGGAQVWLTSDSGTGITVATSVADAGNHAHGVSLSGLTTSFGGTETRPRNIALTPIIKI